MDVDDVDVAVDGGVVRTDLGFEVVEREGAREGEARDSEATTSVSLPVPEPLNSPRFSQRRGL